STLALLSASKARFLTYPTVYLEGLVLGFPLLVVPFLLRIEKWLRAMLFVMIVFLIGLSVEVFTHFHYEAPMFVICLLLSLWSARYLRLLKWKRNRVGKVLVNAWAVYSVISLCSISVASLPRRVPELFQKRAQIIEKLSQEQQKQLVSSAMD